MSDSNHKHQDAPHDATATNVSAVEASDFLQSGWRVAVSFLAPSLLGIWLDSVFGTGRILTVVGVLVGFVLVKVVVYQYVKGRHYGEVTK